METARDLVSFYRTVAGALRRSDRVQPIGGRALAAVLTDTEWAQAEAAGGRVREGNRDARPPLEAGGRLGLHAARAPLVAGRVATRQECSWWPTARCRRQRNWRIGGQAARQELIEKAAPFWTPVLCRRSTGGTPPAPPVLRLLQGGKPAVARQQEGAAALVPPHAPRAAARGQRGHGAAFVTLEGERRAGRRDRATAAVSRAG